jgi:hypothetical protein
MSLCLWLTISVEGLFSNRVVIHNIHVRGFVCFVLVEFMIDLDLCLSVGVL